MADYKHVITFLANAQRFANTTTSDLMVDNENTVDDVFSTADTTGGLIAEIDNAVAEIKWKLQDYYEQTGNVKLLERLNRTIG